MNKRIFKISIFMLLMSVCACCFFSHTKSPMKVYAAENEYDCYYVLNEDNEVYEANIPVGKASGDGMYILGSSAVELVATANSNFQLAGWQVTYTEQSNITEYFDVRSMTSNSKEIKLTPSGVTNEEDKIVAILTNVNVSNGYALSGTFSLSKVFEDLIITPVFDHIYYNVNIDNLMSVTTNVNSREIGNTVIFESEDSDGDGKADTKRIKNDVLFFNEAQTATSFQNAYVKTSYKHYVNDVYSHETDAHYYFYENLETDGVNYYTLHPTLADTPTNEKIDYSYGAYRIGDEVNLAFDVDIDNTNVYDSKNIDVKGASIVVNSRETSLGLFDSQNPKVENYAIVKDSYSRTKSYNINFLIKNELNYTNKIDLKHHKLYIADVDLLVDGNAEHEDRNYILGENQTLKPQVNPTKFMSNVNISNFYSVIDENKLMFFVKTSSENNAKSFAVNSVETVNATIDGELYSYFTFNTINGSSNSAQTFANINANLDINIDYLPVTQKLIFEFAELIEEKNGDKRLVNFQKDAFTAFNLERGETIDNDGFNDAVDDIEILGYKYVGYVDSLNEENAAYNLKSDFTYSIDKDKPVGKTVVLCFQKIDYNINLTNYNQITIGSYTALKSFTLNKTSFSGNEYETLSADGVDAPLKATNHNYVLNTKIKLNDSVSIVKTINTGFDIKFSLLNPTIIADLRHSKTDEEMQSYFIENFIFDMDLLSSLNLGYAVFADYENWDESWENLYVYDLSSGEYVLNTSNTRDINKIYYTKSRDSFVIYAYEEKLQYTITYQTAIQTQNGADTYVMADIDVVTSKGIVTKFNLNGQEAIGNDKISKIVISGLNFGDEIKLKSKGCPYETTTYSFIFFLVGGKPIYNLETVEKETVTENGQQVNYFNATERVTGSRTIDVVYNIPVATILFAIDEDFSDLATEPSALYEISSNQEIAEIEGEENTYTVAVGAVITVDILTNQIPYGYEFVGYQIGSGEIKTVAGFSFTHTTTNGGNVIKLIFKRTIFHFYFVQFGGPFDDVSEEERFVKFDGRNYAELNVNLNSPALTIEKPLGYYVSNIKFGNKSNVLSGTQLFESYSNDLSENNSYRANADILNYSFRLTKQQLINLVDSTKVDSYQATDYDEDGILDVFVRVDYLIFTYELTINFGL